MNAGRRKTVAVWLALALTVAVVAWLGWPRQAASPAQGEAASPARATATPAPPPAEPAVRADAVRTPDLKAPSCPHQRLAITLAKGVQTACVGATRSTQTGSLRSHAVDAEGVSNWRLRVDVAAGQVRAVRLAEARPSNPGAAPAVFTCKGKRCQGASIGEPDRHGARMIVLEALPLAAVVANAAAPASAASVRVAATLQIAPESQNVARACQTPSITVLDGQGAAIDFCPAGGAGFEVGDDGRLSLLFMDLEGRRIAVELAAGGAVAKVTLGALGCAAPYCGGVSQAIQGDAAEPGSERSFSFSGTTLQSGSSRVTLTGSLTMPAQNP